MGKIFNSVAGQIWRTFSTLYLDIYEGHFQLCYGRNVGHIFNSVVGQMWGTFSTLCLDKCEGHFQLCDGTTVGLIFNSGGSVENKWT